MAKGLLIQRKGPIGVVMTRDGQFTRIFLWGKNHNLGQEAQGTEIKFPSVVQGAVAAVVALVMFVGLWINMLPSPAAAAAYVALDINPSLELTVNRTGTVIKAVGLDEDGERLLTQVATMDKELYQAVELLVAGAAQYEYLNETNNVVLATVTATKEVEYVVDEEKLQTTVQQTVATLPVEVKVVTEHASPEEHQQATQKGVSVGRYLIHQNSNLQGKEITLEEVKQKGLGQLEKEKGIEIQLVLPHAKYQVQVKDAKKVDSEKTTTSKTMAPGQLKKNGEPGYAVDVRVIESDKKREQDKKDRSGKNADNRDDDKENDEDDDGEKRRDDRRPSHLNQQEEVKSNKDNSQQQKQDQSTVKDNKKDKQKDPSQKKSPKVKDHNKDKE